MPPFFCPRKHLVIKCYSDRRISVLVTGITPCVTGSIRKCVIKIALFICNRISEGCLGRRHVRLIGSKAQVFAANAIKIVGKRIAIHIFDTQI